MTRQSEKDLLTFGNPVRYKLVIAEFVIRYDQLVETEHLFSDKKAALDAFKIRRKDLEISQGNSAWVIWLKDIESGEICERAAMNEEKLPAIGQTNTSLTYGNPALYKLVMAEIPEGSDKIRESTMFISDFLQSDGEFNSWQHRLEYHDHLSAWVIWVTDLETGELTEYDAMEADQILPDDWDWEKNA